MTGLVLKLLFKATVPLVMLVGVLGYGLHLRGGDPMAILRSVGGGLGERASALMGEALGGARVGFEAAGGVASGVTAAVTGGPSDPSSDRTRVFTWQDEHGITHYASEAPATGSVLLRTLSIDPDVNVLAPMRAPPDATRGAASPPVASSVQPTANAGAVRSARSDGSDESDLPGMAGLTAGMGSGVSPERAAWMLKRLQGR